MSSFSPKYKYKAMLGSRIELDPDSRQILLKSREGRERIFSYDQIVQWNHKWLQGERFTTNHHRLWFVVQDLDQPLWIVNFSTPESAEEWEARLTAAMRG